MGEGTLGSNRQLGEVLLSGGSDSPSLLCNSCTRLSSSRLDPHCHLRHSRQMGEKELEGMLPTIIEEIFNEQLAIINVKIEWEASVSCLNAIFGPGDCV